VVIPQNVKKSQNHCTLLYIYVSRVFEPCSILQGSAGETSFVL
jgi:hypothetical protein